MNPRNLFFGVASVIVMGASFTLMSQGLTDGVKVTLPYAVTVGDVVLDPGEYEIRRPSQSNDQILRFFSNDKLRYQTVVQTIPAEEEKAPEQTRVLLHHIGDTYYFDKIWIEGKNYGYEFPLPDKVRALQRELAVTVPAKYESSQQADLANNAQEPPASLSTQANDRADALAVPAREPEPANSQDRDVPSTQRAPERQQIAAVQREEPETRTPATVESRQDAAPSNIQRDRTNATSDTRPDQNQLPATASNWVVYLVSGVLLLALAGLTLKTRAQE